MRKVIIIGTVLLGLVLFIFWLTFYAKIFANIPRVLDIRNKYFNSLDKITPKGWFIYRVRPISINEDGSYVYKFPGKFEEMDFENSIITMKDLYGGIWKFEYTPNDTDKDVDKLLFGVTTVAKDKTTATKVNTIIINKDGVENNQPFKKGDVLVLFWRDERRLTEIMSARVKDEFFMLGRAKAISLVKIVWE